MDNQPFIKPEDQPKRVYLSTYDWSLEEETLKPQVIKEIKALIKHYSTWLEEGRKKINELNNSKADPTLVALEESSQELFRDRKKQLEKKLRFINRDGFNPSDTDFEWKFKQAKEVPLGNLLKFDISGFALCPFHSEKTGSFKWYKQENKGYCFSCCVRADPIDLYMKLYGVDFKAAVEALAN